MLNLSQNQGIIIHPNKDSIFPTVFKKPEYMRKSNFKSHENESNRKNLLSFVGRSYVKLQIILCGHFFLF